MNAPISLERCFSFINCQLRDSGQPLTAMQNGALQRAVTISRQAGLGAHYLASALASLLAQRAPEGSCPWTVFDKNLVGKVLDDHHLPSRLARFMPEDRISTISDTMDELFGLHPPSDTLVQKTTETILRLVEMGNVIVIGRAAHVITARLDYVFRVRLVGSLHKRIERVMTFDHLNEKAARDLIKRQDAGRKRYVKTYYHVDSDDPLFYHLIINTDLFTHETAARLIADQIFPVKPAPAVKAQPAEV